jgi:hypothetical protein
MDINDGGINRMRVEIETTMELGMKILIRICRPRMNKAKERTIGSSTLR